MEKKPERPLFHSLRVDASLSKELQQLALNRLQAYWDLAFKASDLFETAKHCPPSLSWPTQFPTRLMQVDEFTISVTDEVNPDRTKRDVSLDWRLRPSRSAQNDSISSFVPDGSFVGKVRRELAQIFSILPELAELIRPPLIPYSFSRNTPVTPAQMEVLAPSIKSFVDAHNAYIHELYGDEY